MDLALEHNSPNGIYNILGELHSVKEIYDLVANHLSVDKDVPIVDLKKMMFRKYAWIHQKLRRHLTRKLK